MTKQLDIITEGRLSIDGWRDLFARYMLFVEQLAGSDQVDTISNHFTQRERNAIQKIKNDRLTGVDNPTGKAGEGVVIDSEIMTVREVCAMFGVSVASIRRWRRLADDPLPAYRPGTTGGGSSARVLFVRADVLDWLRRQDAEEMRLP